jgi:hypothetical protein
MAAYKCKKAGMRRRWAFWAASWLLAVLDCAEALEDRQLMQTTCKCVYFLTRHITNRQFAMFSWNFRKNKATIGLSLSGWWSASLRAMHLIQGTIKNSIIAFLYSYRPFYHSCDILSWTTVSHAQWDGGPSSCGLKSLIILHNCRYVQTLQRLDAKSEKSWGEKLMRFHSCLNCAYIYLGRKITCMLQLSPIIKCLPSHTHTREAGTTAPWAALYPPQRRAGSSQKHAAMPLMWIAGFNKGMRKAWLRRMFPILKRDLKW